MWCVAYAGKSQRTAPCEGCGHVSTVASAKLCVICLSRKCQDENYRGCTCEGSFILLTKELASRQQYERSKQVFGASYTHDAGAASSAGPDAVSPQGLAPPAIPIKAPPMVKAPPPQLQTPPALVLAEFMTAITSGFGSMKDTLEKISEEAAQGRKLQDTTSLEVVCIGFAVKKSAKEVAEMGESVEKRVNELITQQANGTERIDQAEKKMRVAAESVEKKIDELLKQQSDCNTRLAVVEQKVMGDGMEMKLNNHIAEVKTWQQATWDFMEKKADEAMVQQADMRTRIDEVSSKVSEGVGHTSRLLVDVRDHRLATYHIGSTVMDANEAIDEIRAAGLSRRKKNKSVGDTPDDKTDVKDTDVKETGAGDADSLASFAIEGDT